MSYAQVIVDLSSDSVDKLFTYRVPEGMALQPGHRVLVPFGPRKIEGYVIDLCDEVTLDPSRLRNVERMLDPEPAILPELIELSLWMQRTYHSTLVDALRLMIPAQMRGNRVRAKVRRIARLSVDGQDFQQALAQQKRAPQRKRILEMLTAGPMPTAEIGQEISGASAMLRRLEQDGFIEIIEEEVYRTPFRDQGMPISADPPLMHDQKNAISEIVGALDQSGGRFLLHGVTGSGKTEVYIHVIRHVLEQGRTAIVLVPEIALTPQMVDWFRARFGKDAAVLHSRLSAGERFDEWMRIRRGDAKVVIGARSAVFAPLDNLGIVIVDEEHEQTYLSERRPRYDAREVAAKRAQMNTGVLLLGSATPSIATYMRTVPGVRPENRLTLLRMPERVMGRPMPEVQIVDMRDELAKGNHSMFSGVLVEELNRCLESGQQAILFLNRRGHSTFVSCRSCGHVVRCDACDVAMTYHQSGELMRCHYCGKEEKPPKVCPECGSKFIRYFGAGTQKVQTEIERLFPGVPVSRMDMDTTSTKDAHLNILNDFRQGKTRILVGTQMIAKGLDFPSVTLVGVIAADMSLNLPDYRSVERTFQLITQVAGRAGRAQYLGRVVVQTYDPDHYGIQLAAMQDYTAFYHKEADRRRRGLYPPYTVLARLLVSSKDAQAAQAVAEGLEKQLNDWLNGSNGYIKDVVQMRAMEAPLKFIRSEHRWQVFIKIYARGDVDAILEKMEALQARPVEGVRIELEVNPANML